MSYEVLEAIAASLNASILDLENSDQDVELLGICKHALSVVELQLSVMDGETKQELKAA